MKTAFKKLVVLSIAAAALSGCFNNNVSNTASSGSSAAAPKGSSANTLQSTSFTILSAVITNPTTVTNPPTAPTATLAFNANGGGKTLNDVCVVQASGGSGDTSRACKCRYQWAETNTSDSSVITRSVDTEPSQITSFQVQCPVPSVYTNEIPDNTIMKVQVVGASTNKAPPSTNNFAYTKTATGATGDFRDAEGRTYKNVFHYVCYDKFQKALTITHKIKAATQTNTGSSSTQVFLPVANDFELGANQASVYSAQSYYYDFYVRSHEIGSINSGNDFFTCPMVSLSGLPSYYPMDTSFALALNPSKDFNLTVTSATVISTQYSSAGILGYAAKPNADGSCPAFLDQNNNIRRTFRLRQYSAVYPIRFNADGDIADKSQPLNVVYVLDRPVDKVGQDPLKPITRLGPKPCPFSYKTAQFGYKCSSDSTLTGWNIDGTQVEGDPGCPVYPPPPNQYMKSNGTLVIRPYKAFTPHYMENTNFKACAFQSSVAVDAEIVLSHDDNVFAAATGPNDFYCAKHYPAAGSVIPPPNGDPFDKPPSECDLAANANAIKTDKTYACSKTYDPYNGVKNTPQAGCCQICSGSNCTAAGGGTTPAGRNAAFSPPQDTGNPAVAMKQLTRGTPNLNSSGCFDPTEP